MVTRVRERKTAEVSVEKYVAPAACAHHWMIEVSKGPTSKGVCKVCGQRKEFLNAIPESPPMVKQDKHPLALPKIGKVSLHEKERRS